MPKPSSTPHYKNTCAICGLVFTDPSGLGIHVYRKHSGGADPAGVGAAANRHQLQIEALAARNAELETQLGALAALHVEMTAHNAAITSQAAELATRIGALEAETKDIVLRNAALTHAIAARLPAPPKNPTAEPHLDNKKAFDARTHPPVP